MSGLVSMLYPLVRKLLFRVEPERAHVIALHMLRFAPSCFFEPISFNDKPIHVLGLKFSHPIGLAAGLDKNGDYLDALAKLGFSYIELGTVTPRPQPGLPKPRLFRLPEAHALINRMGFNNKGVDALVSNVLSAQYDGILGINIGKNKDTPLENAIDDYLFCLRKVYPFASYVTINISSPNTPHLRELQGRDYFSYLMYQLREEQLQLADQHQSHVPIVVKVSPDETDESLKQMANCIAELGIDGIIASNTTIAREEVSSLRDGREEGGLSGNPLFFRSTQCLRLLKQVVGDAVTLIGVGGIDSPQTAREKLDAGAQLLQVYTGLIYEGPSLIKQLVEGIERRILG
jgi:dihydroorotate dehydrogenase